MVLTFIALVYFSNEVTNEVYFKMSTSLKLSCNQQKTSMICFNHRGFIMFEVESTTHN